jgi:ankyrin repeat protein/V8-like Glu-specific endopeptidase
MKRVFAQILLLSCTSVLAQNVDYASIQDILAGNKVIYGPDNRVEVYQATAGQQKLAASTAAMVAISDTEILVNQDTGETYYQLKDDSLSDVMNVCSSERYATQPAAAMCSGFLVGPDLLVTAGHCVNTSFDCEGNVWVFDYNVDKDNNTANTQIAPKDVYKCKSIVNYKYGYNIKSDYSLIELERVVEGRDALSFRTEGEASVGDEILVIGHPSGLPAKVATNAAVRSTDAEVYFTANLDTFGGNSGSAVFNAKTSKVEGILVRGEKDYVYEDDLGCRVVYECKDDECRGEDVTLISQVKEIMYIEQINAAVMADDIELVSKILSQGLNPYMHDKNFKTPLMIAVEVNNVAMVRALIKAGAKITRATAKESSPIIKALKANNIEMITELIKEGTFTINSTQGDKIVEFALRSDSLIILEIALAKGLALEATVAGNTLLARAIQNSSTKIAEALINKGADVQVMIDNNSPLVHMAVHNKMNAVVAELLDLGADINTQTVNLQNTALHEAIEVNNISMAKILIQDGANIKVKNALGQTVSKMAKALKRKEIKKMILKEKIKRFLTRITKR